MDSLKALFCPLADVDARLPDGSRVNAVIPPAAIDGPNITIRKFSKEKLQFEDLIQLGSITADIAEFMTACVKARLNILVSGGTGSGKTTLLNILSGAIPEGERIVTIEDAAELDLHQIHRIRLETKPPDVPGQEFASNAARSHHRRRGSWRRGAGHAASDEHRT
jgi:pilus assembly protein CpaF